MACDSRDQIKSESAWAGECGDGAECLSRLLCEGEETDDCFRQTEAVKNGRGERSCPMEMCREGSSINILIKASQALESPREQTAFSSRIRARSCSRSMSTREHLRSASAAL